MSVPVAARQINPSGAASMVAGMACRDIPKADACALAQVSALVTNCDPIPGSAPRETPIPRGLSMGPSLTFARADAPVLDVGGDGVECKGLVVPALPGHRCR